MSIKFVFTDRSGRCRGVFLGNRLLFEESIRRNIPKEITDKEEKVTFEDLLSSGMDFTTIVRSAFVSKPIEVIVLKEMVYRPLPMNPEYVFTPFQIEVLQWMKMRESTSVMGVKGGVLALVMGAGKTITSMGHTLLSPKGKFPTLIVCSKSVMNTWREEPTKFFGDRVKILYFHQMYIKNQFKTITRKEIELYDIVVTTFEVCANVCRKRGFHERICELGDSGLLKDKVVEITTSLEHQADIPSSRGPDVLYGTPWERVIVDESAKFANHKRYRYKSIMALHGKYKWCLSGKPIPNYDTDLWAQLRFCGYTGTPRAKDWSVETFRKHGLEKVVMVADHARAGIVLPPKQVHDIRVRFGEDEQKCYDYILGLAKEMYDQVISKLCSFSCMLTIILRLRQTCIAPYIMTNRAKRHCTEESDTLKLLKGLDNADLGKWVHTLDSEAGMYSAKVEETVRIIKDEIPDNEQALIFSNFKSALDVVARRIDKDLPSCKYEFLDGDTPDADRAGILQRFREGKYHILLLTYGVGGEGLNLACANHVIRLEPWWNIARIAQADARVWRTGQKKKVHIWRILAEESIETSRILQICGDKELMAENFLEGKDNELSQGAGLSMEMIGSMLGKF